MKTLTNLKNNFSNYSQSVCCGIKKAAYDFKIVPEAAFDPGNSSESRL
jgi:hypothetical protein